MAAKAALAAMLVALLARVIPGWGLVVLAVGVLVFVLVMINNPAYWLRRSAAACIFGALAIGGTPQIGAALNLGSLGIVIVKHGVDGWIAGVLLAAGVALALIDRWGAYSVRVR